MGHHKLCRRARNSALIGAFSSIGEARHRSLHFVVKGLAGVTSSVEEVELFRAHRVQAGLIGAIGFLDVASGGFIDSDKFCEVSAMARDLHLQIGGVGSVLVGSLLVSDRRNWLKYFRSFFIEGFHARR